MYELSYDAIGFSEALQQDGMPKTQADRIARSQQALLDNLERGAGFATKNDIALVRKDIEMLEARMNSRFEQTRTDMDSRFAQAESRLGQVESRIEKMEVGMENRFGQMEASMESRFAQMQTNMAKLETNLTNSFRTTLLAFAGVIIAVVAAALTISTMFH